MRIRRNRIAALIVAPIVASGALVATTAVSADAAGGGCVTRSEYRAIKGNMTPGKVHRIFDTKGTRILAERFPMIDENGEMTGEEGVDVIRAYRKCRSFDGGRGQVGVNFDNYTQAGSGMRTYGIARYNPERSIENPLAGFEGGSSSRIRK